MDSLDKIRETINGIDEKIAGLFEERMKASREVALYKKQNGLSISDPVRESQVIARNSELISDEQIMEYYSRFQQSLMDCSKAYQGRILNGMKIAYCGVPGAFAHIAATRMFPDAELIPFNDFEQAYRSCESGETDCAVLPIENSFAGDVASVMDLMFSGNLHINQVTEISAVQNLLGKPGATKNTIREVLSHPQALSQCADFIKSAGYISHEYPNTAVAARYVAEHDDLTVGAIASEEAARIFGLEVIEKHVNTSNTNSTRFAAFSRVLNTDPGARKEKHSILTFTVKNEAGSLAKTLNILGSHGFNMCSLKSRPMKDLMWSYYFYLELDGSILCSEGREMMRELGSVCGNLKHVGTFQIKKDA